MNSDSNPATSSVGDSGELVHFSSLGVTLCARFVPGRGSGRRPVLVVSHGAGEFKENYHELAAHLAAQGISSLLLDMHGHGASGGRPYHVSIREWVADLGAALEYLASRPDVDAARVGAFGLSSGGTAILEAAATDPRWKALVTLDATVMNTLPWSVTLSMGLMCGLGWLKRLFTGADLRISIVKLLDEVPLASDPQINARLRTDPGKLNAFQNFPLPGAGQAFFVNTICRVHAVRAATLVLWGADDQLDPPSTAHRLHDALTCEKRLEIIEGNGHVGHLDRHRARVFQATTEWLLKHLA
jgi:pimeloyl-ACP methyl ester carboxylesterase